MSNDHIHHKTPEFFFSMIGSDHHLPVLSTEDYFFRSRGREGTLDTDQKHPQIKRAPHKYGTKSHQVGSKSPTRNAKAAGLPMDPTPEASASPATKHPVQTWVLLITTKLR